MENELSVLVSWLISFIGIGVTALLGINIWTSLSIDKKIKEIVGKEVADLKQQNDKLRKQLINYAKAIGERAKGDQLSAWGATTDAFYNYINSLEYSFNADNKELLSENLNDCIEIIRINPSFIIDNEITIDNIEEIKRILLNIQDERSYELYSYFVSLSKNDNSQSPQELLSGEKNEEDNIE